MMLVGIKVMAALGQTISGRMLQISNKSLGR